MDDRPILPTGLRFHSDGLGTEMIQRTPIVEYKLRIQKYEDQTKRGVTSYTTIAKA